MRQEQFMLLAAFMGAVAIQLTGLEHWADATSPAWVGGLVAQVAILLRAFYTPKPGGADELIKDIKDINK
jgi:hypothetical protein